MPVNISSLALKDCIYFKGKIWFPSYLQCTDSWSVSITVSNWCSIFIPWYIRLTFTIILLRTSWICWYKQTVSSDGAGALMDRMFGVYIPEWLDLLLTIQHELGPQLHCWVWDELEWEAEKLGSYTRNCLSTVYSTVCIDLRTHAFSWWCNGK